jgi:hypothetical protein
MARTFWNNYKDRFKTIGSDADKLKTLQKLDIYDFGYLILNAAAGNFILKYG